MRLAASLVVQMVRACDAYLATGEHKPTPTITARLNFQLAFARISSACWSSPTRPLQARGDDGPRAGSDEHRGTALALRNKGDRA